MIVAVSTLRADLFAAAVILNEYNAVSLDDYLDGPEYSGSEKQDPHFASVPGMPDGRIQGNGGNWIELVVVENGVDMRGWELRWAEHESTSGTHDIWTGVADVDQGIVTFGTAGIWSGLRAGTIITISELQSIPVDTTLFYPNRNFTAPDWVDGTFEATIDLSTDTGYDPEGGDWWIHVSTLDELDKPEPLVSTVTNVQDDGPGNFSVGNNAWQLTILDASGEIVFGPVGEGIGKLRGVSDREVGKLEEDPSPSIDPETAAYNDGTSSAFGAPNDWSGGEFTQDFGALRGTAELQAGDADRDYEFDQLDLVQVQIAGKYLTGQPATWGEGDWDHAPGGTQDSPPPGDGLFDQQDIVAALEADHYLKGRYRALRSGGLKQDARTSLGYDASNGELWVEPPAGAELTSISISSAARILTGDPAANLGGSFDNDADDSIFKATFGGSFGAISFGAVATPGLSEDFVLNDLTVVGSLAGGGGFADVDLTYVPVPEPSAVLCLVAGLACVGFLGRRMRDSSSYRR